MVRSLAVILIPVVVISVLFTRNVQHPPVRVVDWTPVLAAARQQSPYAVLAPTAVPQGWRPTVATWTKRGASVGGGAGSSANAWQLGFLTDRDVFVAINQRDADTQTMVATQTRNGVPDGESAVNGAVWQRVASPDDRTHALVSTSPQVTTVVSGDLGYEVLDSYAATLSSD
ncbi:MAG: hypothetical protein JWP61_2022 [Friedmanniella sp.]|nr:hypothetical protein [Friedmanniella sp.]